MSRLTPLFLLALAGVVAGNALIKSVSVASMDSEDEMEVMAEKNRPVTKVINMLKDMVAQLEKEGEEDEEIYQQMGCWCETGDKEKTKSIADAEGKINDLSSAIEELTAKSAQLTAEMGALTGEVSKNTEAMESATALRDKQLAEFNAEEKDMIMSVTSLKGAVIALSKNHEGASLLQVSSERSLVDHMSAAKIIQEQFARHRDLLADKIDPRQHKLVLSFLQGGSQLKQPQSGAIFGILKAMKENFETNLAQSQKEEMENAKAYEDLKKAKKEEIKAGSDLVDTKTQETADTDEKNANSKKDLEDTRNTLTADTEFLMVLKEQCQNVDHEYEERTKTRQLEIQATSKALEFLSSDEAHDLFTRTFNFVQIRSQSTKRAAVSKMLAAAAKRSGDQSLMTLAIRTRVQKFEEVKVAIQEMIDKLKGEKVDDIKLRDYCIDAFHEQDMARDEKKHTKSTLETKIEDLGELIERLTNEIKTLKAEIKELQQQLKVAGEDREKANEEFKLTVADQRATAKLLKVALDILKGFYDKAALMQKSASVAHVGVNKQAPPPGFKTMEKNASSGGVMGMMQSIIDDSKALEEEAMRDEKEGQAAYEDFVAETNASIEAKTNDCTSKSEEKSKAESDKVEREAELEATIEELNLLDSTAADLHKECDYIMKNFESRNEARDSEAEALGQAMAIFSGASFAAFLEFKLP